MYLSHRQPPVQPWTLPGERVAPRGRGVKDKHSHSTIASEMAVVVIRQRHAALCGGVLGTQTLPTTTALASSALLQPYFHGRLGPKTFLVGPETAHEIGKKLPAYGPPSAATCSLLVLNHF